MRVIGDANAPRLRDAFQSCRQVHAIAEDVATVDDDVANVDPNAELDPPFLRHVSIAFGHSSLNINGTSHRVYDTAELSQQPVSGVLDNPPTVLNDFRINERAQVILEPG